jgi:hypothetical protein
VRNFSQLLGRNSNQRRVEAHLDDGDDPTILDGIAEKGICLSILKSYLTLLNPSEIFHWNLGLMSGKRIARLILTLHIRALPFRLGGIGVSVF